MADFTDPKFSKSILDIAQAYGPYTFWSQNLVLGSNPDATWRALMVVAALKDPLYAESTKAMLSSPDSRVRAWASTAIAALGYRPAFANLQELIFDPSRRVRYHARQAVRKMEGETPFAPRFHHGGPAKDKFILISEDDRGYQRRLTNQLMRMGLLVETALTEGETIGKALKLHPWLIITDNQKGRDNLSGLNTTWDLCRSKEIRDTLIFMISADRLEPIFLWNGGDEFFHKPINITFERTLVEYLQDR